MNDILRFRKEINYLISVGYHDPVNNTVRNRAGGSEDLRSGYLGN